MRMMMLASALMGSLARLQDYPPQELPGGSPNEIPARGPQEPRTLYPVDKPGIVDLHRPGAGCDSGSAYSTGTMPLSLAET